MMSLETLASSLSLRSKRQLQEIRAAMLVTSGEYELANRLIRSALSVPSHIEDGSRAVANLSYLRLAVAMRDEKLARDIMSFIAADAHTVSGADAVDLYATAASYTHKWPDSPITQR
jgi:hypothetical protein